MSFKKGKSGNPNGRPRGAKNKCTLSLRASIIHFLEKNFNLVQEDFDTLPAKYRVKLYCDLLQYGLPKLQSVETVFGFENMTEDQLDIVINELSKRALKQTT